MKHTRILFLIALVAGLGLMPGWELTSGAQTCQQEGACFAFESQGYITDPSTGQTTIAFRVTNKCRNLVSYVAIGTGGFTRVAPADRGSYNGDLGLYDVAWTRRGGTPGIRERQVHTHVEELREFRLGDVQCCPFQTLIRPPWSWCEPRQATLRKHIVFC